MLRSKYAKEEADQDIDTDVAFETTSPPAFRLQFTLSLFSVVQHRLEHLDLILVASLTIQF